MARERAAVTFKIGGDEIRFEASREAVEAQLEKVMDRLLERGATLSQVAVTAAAENTVEPPSIPTASRSPTSETKAPPSDGQLIERLYEVNPDGRLVMRRIPKAAADVLLLVLYGMAHFQDSPWVPAPTLIRTARESGARFERGDRLLARRPLLVQGQGKARGKRYRLTPEGEEHCRRLVRDLVSE